MEFSFSMDATPRVAIDANAPLFASVVGIAADLGGSECVFRTPDGQTHVMTHQVLQAMDCCRAFLTLAEHTQAVRQVIPSAPAEGITRVLESLVARRLLISEQDFIAALQTQAATAADAPLQLLIRAGERGEGAAPLLQSLAAAGDWRERVTQLTLLSATANATVRAQQQAQLDALSTQTGARTRLIDAVELQARLKRLAGKDPQLLQALDALVASGSTATPGQAFNLALPLLAGQRSLLLDEHARWPLRRHPEFRRGIELRPVDRVAARFFNTHADALNAGTAEVQGEYLSEHDLACGATLGSLFAPERSSAWKAGDLRGVALSEFLTDAGATTIIGTLTGARGAPRSLRGEDLFVLDAQSRAAFNGDRERYLAQLQRAQLWTGTRRAALTRHSADLPLTLDARQFMPFALPFGGGAGSGLAAMLRIARPEAVLLHLPDAIGYADSGRIAAGDIGKQAVTPDFDRFAADYLTARVGDIRAQSGALRLQTAAALLQDLAESSPPALTAFALEYLQFARSDLISQLQRAAEEAGADAPLHWLADLRSIVTVNGRALVQADVPQLGGEPVSDAAGFATRLREQLQQAAGAMQAWPILWDRIQDEAASSKGGWV